MPDSVQTAEKDEFAPKTGMLTSKYQKTSLDCPRLRFRPHGRSNARITILRVLSASYVLGIKARTVHIHDYDGHVRRAGGTVCR
jgi:hypothetical protein